MIWHIFASLALVRLVSGEAAEVARTSEDLPSQEDANSILQVHASIPESSSEKQSNFAATKARCGAGYGLSRQHSVGHAFIPECHGDQCGLKLPSSWSRFANGKMPEILQADYSRQIIKGKAWFNPSVVKLPLHLVEMFPNGRYLAIGNLVNSTRPWWPPNGTHAVVLNPEFEPIAEARIVVRRAQHDDDDTEIMQRLLADGRLLVDHNGHILIGFTPYSIRILPNKRQNERRWQCSEFVAIVRISKMSDGSLSASVDHNEMRMLGWPGVAKLPSDECLKNLGFISKPSGQIDVILYVHPTRSAQFDFADLSADKANKSEYVTALALNSLRSDSQIQTVPWEGAVKYQARNANTPSPKIHPSFLHNGPHPIWVEELQEYLGIGHIVRGQGDLPGGCYESHTNFNNHHYTNLFFTLSSGPDYHIKRVSKREWCLPSSDNPDDCDTVQFVSGLVRDGGHFHVAYGVHDSAAFIVRVSVKSVLDSLQTLHSTGHSDPV